jgi:hypothetical protein
MEFQLLPSSAPGGGLTSSFILLAGPGPQLVTLTSYWVQAVLPSLHALVSCTCTHAQTNQRHFRFRVQCAGKVIEGASLQVPAAKSSNNGIHV